ncbi:pyridoxamine 5'-phosphate oxidase family protein [Aliikangiella sp. IMCC44359]|uniref:pyridoxamine 5'-phosphate oxidase family protein n=1 Tax=Aliikangiella sp. IMCC44359 TaxID=3459125 RepID=UPI00403B157B
MSKISTLEELDALYGPPVERALWKEIDYINEYYQQFIEACPFLILATYGEKGIDCSSRGDPAGFVRVVNKKNLLIPDRRGNNRLDSLRNIIVNPNVGLIFIIPNVGETIRVSGTAEIITDNKLCDSFSMNNKPASSVLSISVEKAYFQCQKAIARSQLWDSSVYIDRTELPTAGQMAQHFSKEHNNEFDGEAYDKNYPEHMKNTIY